tara:strand:+ start:47 stop:346 length:300 start_codon:yes stop_codon:yes gene_type:complete
MNDEAVNSLLEKLNSFQDSLSDEEAKAFAGMIEMAAESAEELSQEDLKEVAGGKGPKGLNAFKYHSKLDKALAKPQSSHMGLNATNLRWLNQRMKKDLK